MYGFDIPEGLSPAALRAHPVNQLLRDAAQRDGKGIPTPAALDALKLPAPARKKVAKAAQDVAVLFQGGEQEDARNLADARSAAILSDLAPEYHRPNYLDKSIDVTEGMSPGQLAEHVLSSRSLL